MSGTGTALIDFGAGGNEAQIDVLVPEILATSKAESWVMADDTSIDHTAADHRYFPVFASLTCGTPTVSTGFTIFARSIHKLTGKWTVRFVWAD